jgi:3-dehydroquinate synthase
MSSFQVKTSRESYSVTVGDEIVGELSATVLIADDFFHDSRHVQGIPSVLFHANESNKTLTGCEELLSQLKALGLKRDGSVAALGGGVIQDVSTLAASLYMRGVDWRYIPTTAMSMLDSCIGGKSSINVGGIKNLVGNIYPPTEVIVDVSFARTLDVEALASGFSEAVKICFAGSQEDFDKFIDFEMQPHEYADTSRVSTAIELTSHVLQTKRWFIEVDEFDKRERLLLNFGHTFGHALESATNFGIPHGVAISAGMVAAVNHPDSPSCMKSLVLADYCLEMWKTLPSETAGQLDLVDWQLFAKALESDKKGTKDSLRFILPDINGTLRMVDLPRNDRSLDQGIESMKIAIDRIQMTRSSA